MGGAVFSRHGVFRRPPSFIPYGNRSDRYASSVRVEITKVDRDLIDEVWPLVEKLLAWKRTIYKGIGPQVRSQVMAGTSDLWIAPSAQPHLLLGSVIVTTILAEPGSRVLRVHFLAGESPGTWMESAACTLGAFAQASRCDSLLLIGRKKWERFHPFFGPEATWVFEEAGKCQQLPPIPGKIRAAKTSRRAYKMKPGADFGVQLRVSSGLTGTSL